MNNVQRLDWFCRLRSFLREPYVLVALGKDRTKHLIKYDEALSDEIARLEELCYGRMKGVDIPPDVNRIIGHDSDGHYILERETIHTDGTPDEWVKTYYDPCPTSDGMNISQVIVDEWMGE